MISNVLTPAVGRFITSIAPILVALDGDERRAEQWERDCAVEASWIVAGVIDADGLHTNDELWAWITTFAPLVDSQLDRATPDDVRKAGLVRGKRWWLARPSELFTTLVEADAARGTSHAWTYYEQAIGLAHRTQSLDPTTSESEISAVEGFRTMLLDAMKMAGVRRSGTADPVPARTASAQEQAPAEPEPELPPARPLEELLDELDGLVGLAPVKHEVRLVANLLQVSKLRQARGLATVEGSRHLVFTGNPGTGKTTVARLLAQIYRTLEVVPKGHLVETDRSQLVAGFVGQTAIRTREVFDSARGGVLLIDEAYALVRGGENDFGREAIDTIVKLVEDRRDDTVVIVAGYPAEMAEFVASNPGLVSRFPRTIEFPDYTDDELVAIFDRMAAAAEYETTPEVHERLRETLAGHPRGHGFGNARLIRNLFEQSVANHATRVVGIADPSNTDLVRLVREDIPAPPAAEPPN